MANLVEEKITKEIHAATFFSLSVDGTTDISLCEQMTIVIRYAHISDDDMEIKKRFMALVNCEVTTGEEITKYLCQSLQILGIDLRKCVGTSFDGASNMQG